MMSSLSRPGEVGKHFCAMKKGDAPSFGGAILASHQDSTILSNGLRAVHGGEEGGADRNFGRIESVAFVSRKGESGEEKVND